MQTDHGFERTVCACKQCTACCKRQPGSLAPGDYERIQGYTQMTDEEMRAKFWASPGALVRKHDGTVVRIGTITPRFDRRKKACVFLDDNDRCTIHAVAPWGCAYCDTHQSWSDGQQRSNWLAGAQRDKDYQALRNTLPYAQHYKPTRYT